MSVVSYAGKIIPQYNGLHCSESSIATFQETALDKNSLLSKKRFQVTCVASPSRVSTGGKSGESPNGNGNGSVNGSSVSKSSRVIPIELALSRIRGQQQGRLSSGESSVSGRNYGTDSYVANGNSNGNGRSKLSGSNEAYAVRSPGSDGKGANGVNGANGAAPRGSSGTALVKAIGMPLSANKLGRSTAEFSKSYNVNKLPTRLTPPLRLEPIEGELRVMPSDEAFKWAKDDYNKTQRSIDIWSFVLLLRARLFLLDAKWSYPGGMTEAKQKKRRRSLASWVRESILQLGPTFIKLGQLSSSRSDFLPIEFVEELAELQDRVPAFTADKSIALIEKELGAPINILFADFERQPIAAASLGQVHRAILHNGERVVVKVQRPGLKELFDIDLDNMKIIAEYFQKSATLGGPTRDWVGIYEECATILYQEIDYINEGRNSDRFRSDFRKYPWVRVPKVYWDYTSRKVLTIEYAPGVKISDVKKLDALGLNRPLIAQHAIEAYLIQILRTGFFHADPHPGNLAVDGNNALIYYDFGMMGEIKSFTKDKLLEMFYAVYEKDAKKVINALVELGALVPTGDLSAVRRSVQYLLDNLTGPQADQKTTISAIGEDLFSIAVDQPFRFPATFTFVLRAFTTLEGVGKILDSDFSFPKIAAPYAQELLDVRDARQGQDYVVQRLQKQAIEARDATVSMPSRVQRMDDVIRQLEAGDLKLRVRVLEAERAARRASILQVATMNTVVAASFLNIGVSLNGQGVTGPATTSFIVAGVLGAYVFSQMRRIRRFDDYEKML